MQLQHTDHCQGLFTSCQGAVRSELSGTQIVALGEYLGGFQGKSVVGRGLHAPVFWIQLAVGRLDGSWLLEWDHLFLVLGRQGDPTQAANYRPISLLPVVSKILERVVHDQLQTSIRIDGFY